MYSLLSSTFRDVSVVSEEHDVDEYADGKSSSGAAHMAEISSIIKSDELLPTKDLTIWIDPLDATKEYTGRISVQSTAEQTLVVCPYRRTVSEFRCAECDVDAFVKCKLSIQKCSAVVNIIASSTQRDPDVYTPNFDREMVDGR